MEQANGNPPPKFEANLTTMFLEDDALESLWPDGLPGKTILAPLLPLLEGEGGITDPHVEDIAGIGLLAGDLALSGFEDELSQQWALCLEGEARAFRVIGAFHEIFARTAQLRESDVVLIDLGPNLGAINRAALITADHLAIPFAPDAYYPKELQSLGPRLREWRSGWAERFKKRPAGLDLPEGRMELLGYVVMQHAARLDRPVKAYAKWMARIPATYRVAVLGEATPETGAGIDRDSHCLSTLKHYRSLMPLAQEARKPMFLLKPADGAIGSHAKAVQDCYTDFYGLAVEVAERAGVDLS